MVPDESLNTTISFTENTTPAKPFVKGRLGTSRLLKYSLIIIFVLAILWLISTGIITILTLKAMEVGVSDSVMTMVEIISEYLKIDVAAAIGTIATAVVARYGIREATANIKGRDYNSPDSD